MADPQTGIFFPLAGHMAFAIRDGNLNGGSQGGIEIARFHAQGLTLHHTAALRFAHSQAGMNNGQRTHVTALRIDPTTDQLVLGHLGSAIRIEGAGITAGSSLFLRVGTSGLLSTASGTGVGLWSSRGQYSFTRGQASQDTFTLAAHSLTVMNASTHALTVIANPAAVTVNISTSGPAVNARDRAAVISASSWVHFYWVYDGSTLASVSSPDTPAAGPNLPSGYTSWAYAGAVRVDADTDLVGTHIVGSMSWYGPFQRALSAGAATSETAVDLSTFVPPTAIGVKMNAVCLTVAGSVAGDRCKLRFVPSVDFATLSQTGATAAAGESQSVEMPVPTQRVYYIITTTGTAPTLTLDVQGFQNPSGAN